jgi:hypothetical protein
MEQLDGLLASAEVVLDDELLDRIDEIVPPGTDVASLEGAAYSPPWIAQASLRRRPLAERFLSGPVLSFLGNVCQIGGGTWTLTDTGICLMENNSINERFRGVCTAICDTRLATGSS